MFIVLINFLCETLVEAAFATMEANLTLIETAVMVVAVIGNRDAAINSSMPFSNS